MNQLAQRSKMNFVLKVLNGPEKGAIYRLLSHSVKIGRDADNDISLSHDKKCSRHHAAINMTSHGVEIRNTSGRNTMVVDGKEVNNALLSPNSVILLGDTKLQFNLNELEAKSPGAALAGTGGGMSRKRSHRKKNKGNGPSPFFYVAVGVLLLVVYFLLNTNTAKKEAEPVLRSDQDILTQIEENRKISNDITQSRNSSGRNSREYREAHSAYIKGFRDYQKGQYERALSHFQTCRAIDPNHPLCGQAMINAQTKFSELVQYYLRLGYEHQRNNQFKQCKNAFRNVQIMQKDKSSTIYREAEAGFKACDSRERERF